MALPTSRNRTYAINSQVFSSDLNDLQDKIISLNNLITAVAQAVWTGITLAANQHFTVSGTGAYKRPDRTRVRHAATAQRSGGGASGNLQDGGWSFGSAGEILRFAVPVEQGERITAIGVLITDSGTDTLRMLAYKNAYTVGAGVTTTQLGTQQNSAGSTGVLEVLQVAGLTEDVPSTGLTQYLVDVECLTLSSGLVCHGLFVTTTIP